MQYQFLNSSTRIINHHTNRMINFHYQFDNKILEQFVRFLIFI